jgi:putative endonuclease
MAYYVYILECADGTYYTGMTSNLKRRLSQHKNGSSKRAYTYSRRPVTLVWCEELASRDDAKQREKQIKRGNRRWKIALVKAKLDIDNCLD